MKKIQIFLILTVLSGCTWGNNVDPYENWNRTVLEGNQRVDKYVVKPVATVYRDYVPEPARKGVSNFISNLKEPIYFTNHLLQGEVEPAFHNFFRFVINSTIGIAGVLDVAKEVGLEKDETGFNETLASYGVKTGPYIVLPLLGPSSARGAIGLVFDSVADPIGYVDLQDAIGVNDTAFRLTETGMRVIDARVRFLGTLDRLKKTSPDFYAALRNIYYQSQNALEVDSFSSEAYVDNSDDDFFFDE